MSMGRRAFMGNVAILGAGAVAGRVAPKVKNYGPVNIYTEFFRQFTLKGRLSSDADRDLFTLFIKSGQPDDMRADFNLSDLRRVAAGERLRVPIRVLPPGVSRWREVNADASLTSDRMAFVFEDNGLGSWFFHLDLPDVRKVL